MEKVTNYLQTRINELRNKELSCVYKFTNNSMSSAERLFLMDCKNELVAKRIELENTLNFITEITQPTA